ncbi:rna methyltransferase [Holotrichia oblita]|uniref:Rna methyltransferase n=1 Tax=Holotrichia oblita TaxID=644536 RepID=A0ACB9SSV8_HOLOL|nr:rna methyltransferase [Holotrichia oblita]
MHIVNRNQVSTIGAFAPVLCHVGLGESQEFVDILIQIMLDWTMGAHFKLRVYSQVAICKLIEAATEKGYTKIVTRYEILYKSIQKVLQMAGANVDNVLHTDKVFLYYFDINKHYNLHSIFVDIPKLNKVSVTEWDSIDLDLFSFNDIPVSGNVINIENSANKRNNPDDIIVDYSVNNLQKKILPDYDLMVRDESKTKHHPELILIATLVNSSANLGGIARTCEIYGVKQLVVSDRKVLTSKEFKSLSMSSENWVDILEIKQDILEEYLEEVKKTGYITIGIEQTAESIKLHNYKFPTKCVLVLGNEKEGIPSRIFPFLDVCLEIPQFGLLRSLNVHVAGAITVWEYVKQNSLL